MKRIVLTLVTVFSMYCFVACSSKTTDDVTTGNNEVAMNNEADAPVVTAEETAEPTKEPSFEVAEVVPTPTEELVVEATPEPTEEPSVVYEGSGMESDLSGKEWLETFEGIVTEPILIVFSDDTGRKKIIEVGAIVNFNPDVDMLAVYLPEGAKLKNRSKGLSILEGYPKELFEYFKLDPEKTRKNKRQKAVLYVEFYEEEIALTFDLRPE